MTKKITVVFGECFLENVLNAPLNILEEKLLKIN